MTNSIKSIAIDKLVAHPGNPNRMSRSNFAKLVRNIEMSGRYEPLVVRTYRGTEEQRHKGTEEQKGCFQIINGYHRWRALAKLGYEKADCIVWDIDDEQADILLATLNRLGGRDELGRKLALLKRLNKRMQPAELAKLLPQTKRQIERLANLKRPIGPAKITERCLANPMVFFVNDVQQQVVEQALLLAEQPDCKMTRAESKVAALVVIAESFINQSKRNSGGSY